MSVAVYAVDVAWGGTPQAPGAWSSILADVKDATISRGRPSDLATIAQGVLSLRLKDATGMYNPQNAGSTLYADLAPMKPIRLSATFGGTTSWLFHGFISRIEYDPDLSVQETVIEAVDLFEFLNIGNPVVATQTNQTVSTLIGLILDNLGWTTAVQARNFPASGDSIPSWSADGSKSGLQYIQDLLATDLGAFFIDGQGRPTYLARNTLYASGTALATFDGSHVTGLKGTTDVKNIMNQQTVTRTGGAAQTVNDTTSQTAYGTRTGNAITSANLASDSQANSLANFLVAVKKQPKPPARAVSLVNQDDATLTQQLARELFDTVAVTVTRGGTSVTGPIQSLVQTISDGGLVHRTFYAVQAAALNVFTIGTSLLDGNDVIGY
ncbi:MAG: hypothetical protein ACYDHY_17470 [Acidiferrobacterales bacterium]